MKRVGNLHSGIHKRPARGFLLKFQGVGPIDKVFGGAVIRVLKVEVGGILGRSACERGVEKMKIGDFAAPVRESEGHIVRVGVIAFSQGAAGATKSAAG